MPGGHEPTITFCDYVTEERTFVAVDRMGKGGTEWNGFRNRQQKRHTQIGDTYIQVTLGTASREGKEVVDDVNALGARLRILEDERAILQTMHRYGHAMDYGPDTEFVSCFVVDGVWDVRMRRSKAGFTCRGHDEIAASLAAQVSVRAPALYAKHIVVDPRIALDGNNANVVSYFLRVEPGHDGPTRIVASGRYLDQMERSRDGSWRFVERIAEIDDM
jgi:hypothetical protein